MKSYVLFAVALFVSSVSFSQVNVGALAGTNVSIISQSLSESVEGIELESTSGDGFQLGAFAKYDISDKLGIKAEVQFQSRRNSLNTTVDIFVPNVPNWDVNRTIKDAYLGMPILVDLELTDDLSIEVGLSIGLLIGSSSTTEITIAGVTEETTVGGDDAIEGRNSFEIGASVGAHYMLNDDVGIALRYTRAFNDINENNNPSYGSTLNMNYNIIQLNLTYKLLGDQLARPLKFNSF